MTDFMDKPVSPEVRALGIAILVIILVVIITVIHHDSRSEEDGYSVGYQIGPHHLGASAWEGIPYALSPARDGEKPCLGQQSRRDGFTPYAAPDEGPRGTTDPPPLVYTPPFTNDLRGDHPNWWRSDGGSYAPPRRSAARLLGRRRNAPHPPRARRDPPALRRRSRRQQPTPTDQRRTGG